VPCEYDSYVVDPIFCSQLQPSRQNNNCWCLIGAIICASGGEGDGANDTSDTETLGAMIATMGGIGAAMYMTACSNLSPLGLHPIVLTLVINIGMMSASLFLCVTFLEEGVNMLSTNTMNGFWGFLNPHANPPALFDSVFPDCFGISRLYWKLWYHDRSELF
jgi:hypothetical protein